MNKANDSSGQNLTSEAANHSSLLRHRAPAALPFANKIRSSWTRSAGESGSIIWRSESWETAARQGTAAVGEQRRLESGDSGVGWTV